MKPKTKRRKEKNLSLRPQSMAGSCEHGNELSSYIKGRIFLDYMSEYQLIKEDYTPWS
jgi:hypothetical protein